MRALDTASRDAMAAPNEIKAFFVFVKGVYIGKLNSTIAETRAAFPYSELTDGCRVHCWAPSAR